HSPGICSTYLDRRRVASRTVPTCFLFFLSSSADHRHLHSFPTRRSSDLLPALTVKLSKYNVDDVALGVCKTGAEEAGVTEVRTSLSEKKFELWREIKV